MDKDPQTTSGSQEQPEEDRQTGGSSQRLGEMVLGHYSGRRRATRGWA